MSSAFISIFVTIIVVGCHTPAKPPDAAAPATSAPNKGKIIESQAFGEARIAVGMTKDEVLQQIEISRKQYESLRTDLYIKQPLQDTIERNVWLLTCPYRNSHLLGGGSGMVLKVTFTNGVISEIEQLPWLGA